MINNTNVYLISVVIMEKVFTTSTVYLMKLVWHFKRLIQKLPSHLFTSSHDHAGKVLLLTNYQYTTSTGFDLCQSNAVNTSSDLVTIRNSYITYSWSNQSACHWKMARVRKNNKNMKQNRQISKNSYLYKDFQVTINHSDHITFEIFKHINGK